MSCSSTESSLRRRRENIFESINPATEQTLTTIAAANEADVDSAVKAARKAYDKVWSKIPGCERGKYLYRIARIIQEKARELAVLETMDGGKTIKESRDVDLPLVAAHFFYYAGWADKLKYAFPGKTPQPLGVAGQIIPWNFPLLMAAWKIAPALACGNTVVLKPAETTSITALRLAQIFQEAGLPDGVVNIVTGAGATGAALVNHPAINKLAFTGSTEVGKRIAQAVAGTKKKLTLELGGKAANILFEDAPLDQAIEGVINGIYFNQGHVCCAGSRLFVQEGIYSKGHQETARPHPDVARRQSARQEHRHWRDQFAAAAEKDPRAGAKRRGRRRRVARRRNARSRPKDTGLRRRFSRASRMRIAWRPEEIFRAGAERDDLPHAGGGVRAREQHPLRPGRRACGRTRAARFSRWSTKLRAGVVWANTYNKFDPTSPFGGYKESGFGREGGLPGLAAYCRLD